MWRITNPYQIFMYNFNTETISVSSLHFCFHYLSPCIMHFFLQSFTLYELLSHTPTLRQKSTSTHFVHLQDVQDSLACSLSLSIPLCLHLLFSDRVASEVLWEVIQKLPSQGTTDREREMVCKICRRLFIFCSFPESFPGSYRGHFKCLEKNHSTVLNNTGSPQLLHLFFLLYFRSFETADLLQHISRE